VYYQGGWTKLDARITYQESRVGDEAGRENDN
jgi:hypothetical protein